ncbi:MAG: YebC/PmpR family DNA-binding transcriptional regulator [Phycisphaerae bacterium]|jgi:YebC/PmpR family DNA-binding regulatory protein|nr:YebC/PmpR family DNA-binding transcriptional regulator [Phycisphaerae bacterium]HOO15583.1 YebC/PmpR family DNA-binding transcriptional regulator [Phycisphaerae bacterium]HPC21522.1 YebC/PmpR family DNA-binding transcriptional regulator [Phycisphaerae bacterium]HRS26692.1 YebC/PmpR family DNA-binding transcriptional regulator [Phycisphaerae bacterium]HRT40486.1 YebC/PmpR family DNA-binding transcriptional regulator [Phycisphaerae bacterium]
MSGHSHWARIKHAKAVTDSRRGRLWSKLSRAIIVAARHGGGDPAMNLTLRYAIDAARDANMPKDTIERAIKKGTGAGGEADYVELVFEGYGPGGTAILCTALTDNRNRTAPEVKKIFEGRGGKLGTAGSVSRMFNQRGVFTIAATAADEDTLTNIALETGADDVQAVGDEAFELTCDPAVFGEVRKALDNANIKPESAAISMVPITTVMLSGDQVEKMMNLIEALEEHDDVQNVYTNFEISDDDAKRLAEA